MRKLAVLSSLAAVAVLGACKAEPKAAFRTEPVTRGSISEVVTATGEISALVTVSVGTQISGTLSRLHADFNSKVKQGEVLAELDARLYEAALARADAGLAAAQADVERARVALEDAQRNQQRLSALFAKGLIASAENDAGIAARDGAAAGLQAAKARVLQAKADRDTAVTNIALTKIRSPIDGIVISRTVEVGQTVAASLQSPTLFLIANDLSRIQVLAAVDEADVGKVKDGMTARFTVDAFPGEVFQGRIREVRQAPTTVQNVVTYAAVVEAANPERKLRQGMTASISVVTNQRGEALRVPNAALRFRPAGEGKGGGKADKGEAGAASPVKLASAKVGDADGLAPGMRKASAYRLQDGVPVKVSLKIGISDGHYTEVVSGVAEGDQVVLAEIAAGAGGKRGPF
ncbi:MAG TPA: efflux RND transporter periplasmic adaptor subunit [Anaeromyxobacter sp.]|nr:efflux RND transporter periplasmic adaptor subunit [Anaeromyxobacter sp.]